MLLLHGIAEPHAAQYFRREVGNAGEHHAARLRQGIAYPQHAMVGNADDVAGPGLVHCLALAGKEQDRVVHPDGLAGARLFQLHVAFEFARRQPQESHPVAVVGVHVGLHLEDKAGDFLVARLGGAADGRLVARRRRIFRQRREQLLHPEILQRRAEIDRRQMPLAIGGEIELRQACLGQQHVFFQLGGFFLAWHRVIEGNEGPGVQILHAAEVQPHAAGPHHGRGLDLQLVGQFVQQLERIARLAVHLVDEGHDGNVAQPADLEQLAGLGLDALGGVNHHHRGIRRRQSAIGVLGKVFVTRRVQQVEHRLLIFKRHHRAGDRDAAFLLDLHPVGLGAPRLAPRLHPAGRMDRAAQQQQMLRQRGLAGVGMGNDGKCPPSGGFAGRGLRHARGVIRPRKSAQPASLPPRRTPPPPRREAWEPSAETAPPRQWRRRPRKTPPPRSPTTIGPQPAARPPPH